MKALITGITGFVGSHLAEYLLEKSIEVHGIKRWRSPMGNIEGIKDKITLHECDLKESRAIFNLIKEVKPDRIYHLGAQSYVPASFKNPIETLQINIIGTANLLEVIAHFKETENYNPRIHICSSSEVFGQVNQDEIPIEENNQLRPQSPYAVSKVGEDLLGYQYFRSHGIETVITRAFTHTGPGRGEVFVVSAFAKQIAMIEKGLQKPLLKVGNLDSVRTFLDVRDVVKAYYQIVEKGKPGEVYVVGGKETMSIKEMLDLLLRMTEKKIKVEVDPKLLRPSDVTLQIPNTTNLKQATGWEPKIPFKKTLLDTLNYWRGKV